MSDSLSFFDRCDIIEQDTVVTPFFQNLGLAPKPPRRRKASTPVPCFTPGTLITTPQGEVPVERLNIGDRVITRDNGVQRIAWFGTRVFTPQEILEDEQLSPIMIRQGALGENLPARDMMVSPDHRMLLSNPSFELALGETEILVAAQHMTIFQGVHKMHQPTTTYMHMLFDNHEIILADGTWSESLQPDEKTLAGFTQEQRDEIFSLFPELAIGTGADHYTSARLALRSYEAQLLLPGIDG